VAENEEGIVAHVIRSEYSTLIVLTSRALISRLLGWGFCLSGTQLRGGFAFQTKKGVIGRCSLAVAVINAKWYSTSNPSTFHKPPFARRLRRQIMSRF
jgi:hypothetical protein